MSFFVDHFQQREALGDTADFGGALAGLTSADFDAPLVRDALANWRSGKVKEVMAGNFDLLGIVAEGNARP